MRHQRARSRREATKNRLLSALTGARAAEQHEGDPFAEQERELSRVLADNPAKPADHEELPRPGPRSRTDTLPIAHEGQHPGAPFRGHWREERGGANSHESRHDDTWRPLIDPGKVIGGVWKSRYLIVGTTLAGALLAALLAISTPKKYAAVAELLVDPRELQIVGNDVTAGGGLSTEATLAIVENHVRVLTSGSVLTKVVDRLGLDKDPEFNGTREGILGFIPDVRKLIVSAGDPVDPTVLRKALAVESLAESLHVERGGRTFVVEIWARTESPEKSALLANTLTEVFLEASGAIQSRTVGRASDELSQRLAELRDGVEQAEREVEAFKSQNDIVDAQGRLITDDEIVKLNDQLATARARTLELQARADSARDLTVDSVVTGNLPEQMSSPVLTEMRTQYSLLRQEGDRIAARLGPRHPERLAIEEQVAAARERIEQELRLVASSIQVELRRAVQLEQELAARLAQLKARQADLSEELVTLRELEREATAKRAVYEAFLLRARETGEQRDLNRANITVISSATPPLEPSSVSRTFMTIAGAIVGFGAGVLFGAGRGAVESLTGGSGPTGHPRAFGPGMPLPPQGPPPVSAPRVRKRLEGDETDMAPVEAATGPDIPEPDSEISEHAVSARSEAQEFNPADETAATAEEADMYHQKPQNVWVPPYPADPRGSHPGYGPQQGATNPPQYQQAGPGHAAWTAQQPHGLPGHGYPQHQAAPGYGLQPGSLPVGPQQAYGPGYNPMGYASSGGAFPSPYEEPAQHYGHPAGQWHPQMNSAPGGYGQPSQPWHHGQAPNHYPQAVPYSHMPSDPRQGYPHEQAGAGFYPRASLQDAPAQQAAAPAAEDLRSAGADKSAIDEIRESLREFREALRELAETRGRRRFL